MNILFIYTNIDGFHKDVYSFGLASIVSATRKKGHNCKVAIIRNKQEYSGLLGEVASFKPQVVGFSSVSSQFNFVKEIAASIKKIFPNIIIVCGGVHPTINPECVLEATFLDGVFVGESENSFIEFLKSIENKESYKNIDNLAYAKDGKLIVNKLKPLINNLDDLPYPDREIYPFADTSKEAYYAPFLFSRGCPYLCSYCSNHVIAKRYGLSRNYPRYRSPESSIREIEEIISRFRIDTIVIGDDVFGLNKKWREEFCEKYRKRIKIRFICILRADFIDEDFMRLLKSAGCYCIIIGVESGNEYIRKKVMNRQMSNNQIAKAFYTARACGLKTNSINIIGIPGETEEMIWDTIKLNRKIKPTVCGVNIFYRCFEEGLVNENLYYSFSRERRESVLNYPQEYRKKLVYCRENWERLIYPFDLKRFLLNFLKKTFIGKYLDVFWSYGDDYCFAIKKYFSKLIKKEARTVHRIVKQCEVNVTAA